MQDAHGGALHVIIQFVPNWTETSLFSLVNKVLGIGL